jgi:uncharacterized oligopeptide transporter (OPT) family protein
MSENKSANQPPDHKNNVTPIDWDSPQLTIRSVLTGMFLGAILCACNIYAGLKIGWGFNMSITAALLSFGFWNTLHQLSGKRIRHWGILENNINQTACSSAAAVSSAGLVAPIPALAMLTGQTLSWHFLALWCFSVMMVGITVAIPLRRQMIIVDKLPFAFGIAAAETLREMYAKGIEALARVAHLLGAAAISSTIKILEQLKLIGSYLIPMTIGGFPAYTYTLSLKPSLLLVGVGGLIGFRACVSLLLGSILAYAVIAPSLINNGSIQLEVMEPLDKLPVGMNLNIGQHPNLNYDTNRHNLIYTGVMNREQKAEWLKRSDYLPFQQAIRKLYVRSQLAWERPLAALPQGLSLANIPLQYDAKRQMLQVETALSEAQFQKLLALSKDVAYRQSLTALFDAYFRTETIRYVQISVSLEDYSRELIRSQDPKDTNIEGVIKYARKQKRLELRGKLTPEIRQIIAQRLAQYRKKHPAKTARADAFERAIEQLAQRQTQSYLPPEMTWPQELAFVRYDNELKALRIIGIPSKAQIDALRKFAKSDKSPQWRDLAKSVELLLGSAMIRKAEPNFRDLNRWLLWPGVTLMVVSSLVSVAFSWRSFINIFPGFSSKRKREDGDPDEPPTKRDDGSVSAKIFGLAILGALLLSLVLQVTLFQIVFWAALLGVLLTFVLALVAARVSGETSITPVGAMGKVTQLLFGAILPQNASANLMTANVTGGAASQCADLLHDLKCGYLLGAIPRLQILAQFFGAFAGAMSGAAIYLILIPNPSEMLLTEEWAAPAVATWKAVAELFMVGFGAIPKGTPLAILIATIAGIIFPILDRKLPKNYRWLVPSSASLGLAFVIQAYSSFSIFLGGAVALIVGKFVPSWSGRFLVAVCAGVIAGESLTGVGVAIYKAITGIFGG